MEQTVETQTKMASAARARLASRLSARVVERYPGKVLVCGVYGSTARGDATPWSDVELLFVVKNACRARGQHILVRGIPAGYRVYRQAELEAALQHPDLKWPFLMGVLHVLQVIFGDPGQVQRWISLGTSVPTERFRVALRRELPGLVFESHGRLHSCLWRQQQADFFPALLEVLFEMRTALCLLNRRWVAHDYYQGLADTFRFSKLPRGYQDDVEMLYRSRDPESALVVADRLVQNYRRLLSEEQLTVENFQSVEEIAV